MTRGKVAAVVLAAGMGTRMKSDLPKVLHPLGGRPMLCHLLDTVESLAPEEVVTVIGPDMEAVAEAAKPHPTVIQRDRLGTGHAVAQAAGALKGFAGDILILYGDTPLITLDTLEKMLAARKKAAVVVLGFRPDDAAEYGRLLAGSDGSLEAIIEFKDANAAERSIGLCNSGVMAVDGAKLFDLVAKLGNDNAKGEYYLTDIVALARKEGLPCAVVEGEEEELLGINSRIQLAEAEAIFQKRRRLEIMEGGATMADPSTVYFSWDTKVGRDVTIGPSVVFGPGVTVGDRVTIKAFCHFEQATIAAGAILGPYARLRPGAEVGEGAHIGNFVEIKNATVAKGAKVNHLSYIGDGSIGSKANIGAGTIFCNYDGFTKARTEIGAGAFIGSNTALVSPVRVGDGAIVGAGSVITKDVAADALAVARGRQREIPGWAAEFRKSKKGKK